MCILTLPQAACKMFGMVTRLCKCVKSRQSTNQLVRKAERENRTSNKRVSISTGAPAEATPASEKPGIAAGSYLLSIATN